MDILETVILSLSSDEVRRYKILSNRFKAEEEKKLLILFDGIRSGKYIQDDSPLLRELYQEDSPKTRNRYYRLRNKLLDSLEKSLIFYHFKYKDSIHALYDIQLSILFRERGHYSVSRYFLKKAEKKAREMDQFSLLEQVYHEYIQLAQKDISFDLEPILERRKANMAKVEKHRKINEALALITQKLKKANFSRSQDSVLQLLDSVRTNLEAEENLFLSSEGKFMISRVVSTQLLQKEAFDQLALYLESSLTDFEQEGHFNQNNHATRLHMRFWLANSLFKLYRFSEALDQVKILEEEMHWYEGQNFQTYLFNYYNLRLNLTKCLGQTAESTKLIEEALANETLIQEPTQELYLLVSQADHAFNINAFKEARTIHQRILNHPAFESFGSGLRMHITLFGMVICLEAGITDGAAEYIKNFRKKFRKALKQPEHAPAAKFMEILDRMFTALRENKKVSLNAAAKKFREQFGSVPPGGNEIILYDIYLEAARDNVPYYNRFVEAIAKKAR